MIESRIASRSTVHYLAGFDSKEYGTLLYRPNERAQVVQKASVRKQKEFRAAKLIPNIL